MKKNALGSQQDEESISSVEIPGTNLGLKTLVEVTRRQRQNAHQIVDAPLKMLDLIEV